jgi:transposase
MAAKTKRRKHRKLDRSLPEMRPNAGGIDIGATEIFVAVPADRDPDSVRAFPTFTQDLHALADWLQQCRVDTVAMGVHQCVLGFRCFKFWKRVALKCIWSTRSMSITSPDASPTSWTVSGLQYLHSVGLLKTSFRPEQAVCEIRSLMRHCESLIQMAGVHVQHMHKALDQMNLQIHHVISDITGVTGIGHCRCHHRWPDRSETISPIARSPH